MKTPYLLTFTIAAICALTGMAEIPWGYYTPINGKTEAALKAALHDVINPHTQVSSYSDLPQYFRHTDVYPESNRWWDMYSNIPLYAPSFRGLNREHSFPKSWWGGLTDVPAYVDLNHLYPAEADANMAKSNYPLGTVMTAKFDNGITKVGYAVTGQGGGASQVFEPDNEYKGDFARTYFYMVTCYSNMTWNPKYMFMLQQNDYPTLNGWAIDLLLKWSREDPVSQKEIDRNEQVFAVQNNRNPFIDYPELCEYIWGNKKGEPFILNNQTPPTGDPNLITPTQGMTLDFGQVAVGKSVTSRLFFNGENCTGNFTITVAGTDKGYFTPDTRSISASVVNSSSGYWLAITYTPAAVGQHTARLIVSDGGLVGSRGIELRGECLEAPSLTALTATAATDVTTSSYVANWDEPTDEVVDYYIVTRTRYVNGNASSEEIEAENPGLLIEEFDLSDSESYSVQSVRLGYRSPMSNVIFVDHSGIDGIEIDSPLGVNCYPSIVRFICGKDHTNGRIYDMTGKLVTVLPLITNDMEITLPAGVYLITTSSHRRPLKITAY